MAEGSDPGIDVDAVEEGLARLLAAIADEPVPDRIARLAEDLQRALKRRKLEERARVRR